MTTSIKQTDSFFLPENYPLPFSRYFKQFRDAHVRDAIVTDVFLKVQETKVDPSESEGLGKVDLGAYGYYKGTIGYYKGTVKPISVKKPSRALLQDIQEYVGQLKEGRTDYLLLQFAKMIFTADGGLNLDACYTISSFLQKGLQKILSPKKLESQVLLITEHLIQDQTLLEYFRKPFGILPLSQDLVRDNLGLKPEDELTFVDVRWALMLYLFHSGSLKSDDLLRLLRVLQTEFFSFERFQLPIGPICEVCRKIHAPNQLSLLSTAITRFLAVNSSAAREPWQGLSERLFLIEDHSVRLDIVDFQVIFEGYSHRFPFTRDWDDFQLFSRIRRLYYLSGNALIPMDTLTALGKQLGDQSEAFRLKVAQIVAHQNQIYSSFDADWYYQQDALILCIR